MNRFTKALLSVIVCIMGICCFSMGVSAVEGTDGNIIWVLDDETGTLTISGEGDMNYHISINDIPWYEYRNSIKTVVIEEGVTSIGYRAFYYCTNLTSITIPDSVTSIGEGAFCYCENLISITIPNSVESIGATAFYYCTSLTSITIPDSVTSIGVSAFCYCTNLTSVTILGGVKSIASSTFEGCSSLTSVTILGGVESIESYAFGWCSSLTSIIIPGSVTSITNNAFWRCTSLKSAHHLGSEDDVTIGINNDSLTDVLHYMTEVEEVEPTCTEDGTRAYYSCDDENCGAIIYIEDSVYVITTIDDEDLILTAIGHSYEYASNEDGTHMITCANDCGYAEEKNCTYDSGILSDDGTYYTYTCEYCRYYYTEDVEEEEEDTDEDEDNTEEDTDSEEATEDTTTDSEEDTDDSNTDETETSEDTSTTTDTSDSTTTSSTYTNAYIQYIGGILMSGNTSTSTVEDVSTGAGMTAEGSTTSSALAVVSLIGVAMMVVRRKK